MFQIKVLYRRPKKEWIAFHVKIFERRDVTEKIDKVLSELKAKRDRYEEQLKLPEKLQYGVSEPISI